MSLVSASGYVIGSKGVIGSLIDVIGSKGVIGSLIVRVLVLGLGLGLGLGFRDRA